MHQIRERQAQDDEEKDGEEDAHDWESEVEREYRWEVVARLHRLGHEGQRVELGLEYLLVRQHPVAVSQKQDG